jgi:WD40 repeat protein
MSTRRTRACFHAARRRRVSLDGDLAVFFRYVASWDSTLRIWSVPLETLEYELIHTLAHHTQRISSVIVTHRHFVTCSDDETIRFVAPASRLKKNAGRPTKKKKKGTTVCATATTSSTRWSGASSAGAASSASP